MANKGGEKSGMTLYWIAQQEKRKKVVILSGLKVAVVVKKTRKLELDSK